MKKIILIIALIVGFASQAQDDTISFFSFKSASSMNFGDLGHSFSEDFTHCNSNVTEASSVDVYSWNNNTGVLSFNGSPSATYTGFGKNAINGAFQALTNSLLSRNNFGGVTGVVPTTGSGSSLTKN